MLFSEDFSRRHQRHLGTRGNRLQSRQRGHHGFTGTDITLDQSQHGQRLAQILTNVSHHVALGPGQLEWQGVEKLIGQIAGGQQRQRFPGLDLFPHLQQAELMCQQLFHHQPLLGRMPAFHQQMHRRVGWRRMHQLNRLADARQLIIRQQ